MLLAPLCLCLLTSTPQRQGLWARAPCPGLRGQPLVAGTHVGMPVIAGTHVGMRGLPLTQVDLRRELKGEAPIAMAG